MEARSHEMPGTWPLRCSQFNHGWLRNRFCQSLGAAVQIAEGKVARTQTQNDHHAWFQDWLNQEETAKRLIDDFVSQMSPAVLFSLAPLVNLNPPDSEFFRNLAHSLWCNRHNINARIERAKTALALAGERVRELGRTSNLGEAVESGLIKSVQVACQELADSLSELPKTIVL